MCRICSCSPRSGKTRINSFQVLNLPKCPLFSSALICPHRHFRTHRSSSQQAGLKNQKKLASSIPRWWILALGNPSVDEAEASIFVCLWL